MVASADEVVRNVHELASAAQQGILAHAQLPKPVVAAVHGSVAGGGVGPTCAADLMLAGESSEFVAAYPRIAVTPDCRLSWTLSRIIGKRRPLEFMIQNSPRCACRRWLEWARGCDLQVYGWVALVKVAAL